MKEGEPQADMGEQPEVPEAEKKDTPVEDPEAPPPVAPPKTTLDLDSAQGSEVHLAQLGLLNQSSAIKQIQLEIANLEGKVTHLREKLSWEANKLETERQKVLVVLAKYEIPDGWRFNRKEDGTYTFYQPPPAPKAPGKPQPVG